MARRKRWGKGGDPMTPIKNRLVHKEWPADEQENDNPLVLFAGGGVIT